MATVVRTRLELNHVAIQAMLTGEQGPVVKFIRSVTRDTRNEAVLRAPVDTGFLRNAHYEEVNVSQREITAIVGNRASYAGYVHEGTRPHLILPRRPGGVLRFVAQGQVVFTTYAWHPGTRAQPWLFEAVTAVAGRRGFRITRT